MLRARAVMGVRFVVFTVLFASTAFAQAQPDRFSASGYFRISARPDWQGGDGRLGFSDLYGRLMNEGSYAMLEGKLDLLQAAPNTTDTWASFHLRIEGGSVQSADSGNGNLGNFRISQMYVRAGNVLFDKVTWQIGTLWYYYGDLGLYDLRPAQIFEDTIGVSARYSSEYIDVLIGVGDSGFSTYGANYSPMLTAGGMIRAHFGQHFELGVGGQVAYQPSIAGDQFTPHQTPGVTYDAYVRQEVAMDYVLANPGQEDLFPKPVNASETSAPYRGIGYLGFGKWGPLRWDNLFFSYKRLAPDQSYTETYAGREYTIYVADLTRDRYQLSNT